jgi:3-dehydroquinate dehydratase-2
MNKVLLIHGPNLNLLGTREPEKYGNTSSEQLLEQLNALGSDYTIDYFQSNSEAELVDAIQQSKGVYQGIIINPGAYSHTSIAIADAIRSVAVPTIAVHISNIYQRESFRHADLVGDACNGAIVGLGIAGYKIAFAHLTEELI